jgi:predicted DNA-binding transcriptional regulator YafY
MKDLCQYGNWPENEGEILPWIPDPRPPFKIWVKPEQIAPFFLIPHHPYAISLLLKISDGFRVEEFCRLGLTGSSGDWERLVRGVIREFEENNSGVGMFHFDSDEDVFCVYSQYIDDLMMLAKMIRVLELLRFLYERTDENHPATVSDIIAHLNGKGIQAVRQTVYADTNALIDAGIDIVVVKSTQNQYFMGSRLFEYPELKMLTDAVASSKIISAKKSEELVQKLCRLAGTYQAEQLRQFASLSSRVKPDNEQVYYIIDAIQTAILEKRQVQFQYYEYTPEKKRVLKHGGYLYKLDPYALEWKNDHYYLIGFSYKHQRMAHFRVDRLSGIKILPSGFTPDEGFDVAGYTNKIVDMFAADRTISVELLCENKLMKTIIDHYGESVPTRPYDEEHFAAKIEVDPSSTFYGWVFKFMGGIQIIAPQECVEEMKRIARSFL